MLARWVVRTADDRVLDPACGDGRFLSHTMHSVGVEQIGGAAAEAQRRTPSARVCRGEFFAWARRARAAASIAPLAIRRSSLPNVGRQRVAAGVFAVRGTRRGFLRSLGFLTPFLVSRFAEVRIVAVRRKLFPHLSEDCWLLFTDGFGGAADAVYLLIAAAAPMPGLQALGQVTEKVRKTETKR